MTAAGLAPKLICKATTNNGDFNSDGNADILWRNTNNTLVDWSMNGTTISSSQFVASSPDATWHTQAKPTDFA